MNIYYLLRKGQDPARELHNPYGTSHIVRVTSTHYEARTRALAHAAAAGVRRCLVVAGQADPRLVIWPSQATSRSLALASVVDAADRHDHGLLLYMGRMLRQHAAAVIVPPVSALPQMRRGWEENLPLMPVVCGYRVASAVSVEHDGPSLEYNLVSTGHRVVALSDYGHRTTAAPVLDTYGTQTKWKQAYERTQKTLF